MNKVKLMFASAVAAAAMLAPAANGATTLLLGAGSSAIWQTAAIGAYKDLAGAGKMHYTIKGTCSNSTNCAQIVDSRESDILVQGGNLWVVWDTAGNVWADLSVDSVVGDRSFFATPRTNLAVSADVEVTGKQQNLIATSLWGDNSVDAAAIPANIYSKINAALTTGFTDIRPEDAKFATTRALLPLGATTGSVLPGLGLGYGTASSNHVGTFLIKSEYSSATAQVVNFGLSGTADPISGKTVPSSTTIPIGATPIIFIYNATNTTTGLGKVLPTNLAHGTLQTIFSGTNCSLTGNGVTSPVVTVQREPLSGTMNTTEYTVFEAFGAGANGSQEHGVNPANATDDPLNQNCAAGGGKRTRAIGTGELVNTGVYGTPNALGYTFFGYGNVSKIAGSASYRYAQFDSVDPISTSYTNGELPTCTAPCPKASGTSFPNLRNGTYKAWSVIRAVTDAGGPNLSATSALVTAIQNEINSTVPDFVPYKTTNGSDPGLTKYRSHFPQSGVPANNGLSGQTESGGDVGGCIETTGSAPGVLNCHQ